MRGRLSVRLILVKRRSSYTHSYILLDALSETELGNGGGVYESRYVLWILYDLRVSSTLGGIVHIFSRWRSRAGGNRSAL